MSTVDLLLLHMSVVVIVNFHVIQILVCVAQFVDLCPKLFIFSLVYNIWKNSRKYLKREHTGKCLNMRGMNWLGSETSCIVFFTIFLYTKVTEVEMDLYNS